MLLSVAVIGCEIWRCRSLLRGGLRDEFEGLVVRTTGYLRTLSRFEKVLLAVVLYQLALSLMHTLYWPIFSWDALGYWLYYGRAFYEEGTMNLTNHQLWIEIPAVKGMGMAYPMLIPLLYAWLFTCTGAIDPLLANSVQAVFLLVLALTVFRLFKGSSAGHLSFLACMFFLLSSYAIAIHWDAFKGVADFPLFVSDLTLIYLVLRFWRAPSAMNAAAAGLVGGLSGALKQLGLVFVLLAAALVLLRSLLERRERIISRLTCFLAYAASAMFFSLPYYIYSVARAPTETATFWTPAILSAFNLAMLSEFALAVLRGLYTRVWGLAPIVAFIAVLIAWRKIPLTKIVLYWVFGSLFIYYLFVSTTTLGSLEMGTLFSYAGKYTLPIFSLFAVIAGGAAGVLWHKGQAERITRRSIYSIIFLALLVGNVALNFGVMRSYMTPPFMTQKGVIVDRNLDQKYIAKLGGFYEVSMYINDKTPPGSAIITPGYYRYFFFNARDHRKLYGWEERPGLWTSNLTELRLELRHLESPHVYVVEEPWFTGFVPYDFFFRSGLYTHRQEIMTLLFTTDDGYLVYQVKTEFINGNSTVSDFLGGRLAVDRLRTS